MKLKLLLPVIGLALFQWAHAQIASPDSSYPNTAVQLAPPNVERLLKADEENGLHSRVAAPVVADIGLDNSGTWEAHADGSATWTCTVTVPGALGLGFIYDQFYLPPGSQLEMFSPEEDRKATYTFQDNQPTGHFFSGFTKGATAQLVYREPAHARQQGRIHIRRVDYGYRQSPNRSVLNFGFGSSLDCHPNANCDEGADFRDIQRSVCRIVMVLEEGTGYCSGTLINNTAEDETPFVLSAFHCDEGYTPLYGMWRFDFNYESENCGNPSTEPAFQSLMGCQRRASRRESDFVLFELVNNLPPNFEAYFAGWDRRPTAPPSGVMFHHPSGDIKKLSAFDQAQVHPSSINWQAGATPPNHHFDVDFSLGTFEQGSSGSALFDSTGKIRGQLHGGFNGCDNTNAYYGRLTLSWDEGTTSATRLMDWLDPADTGADTLGGLDTAPPATVSIGGILANEVGAPVANATVYLSGLVNDTVTTGADGLYTFFDVPTGSVVGLRASKEDDIQEGISNLDLIRIGQHNLGLLSLDSPYKEIAADVNNSQSISVLDQIAIRKAILGIDIEFNSVDIWRFVPAAWPLNGSNAPTVTPLPDIFMINNITGNIPDFDFVGIKSGDVNNSADPGN
ncbi:MAG: hypothetical protein RIC19_15820 [Phaeodactylibacter sp.]|uniref:hypothetical protein n=1 Tax=Phaeodactylibacter sp. TaxID=1940289 RepID=UPI0032EB44AA